MTTRVEKGREISVMIEQAYPTCILVSFQNGDKTFRGVLLDESNKIAVVRSNPVQDLANGGEVMENLGLTTARTTTCQSDIRHIPSGRVNTRSSAMMLQATGNEGSSEVVTPVHKIRGLVESLSQRAKRLKAVNPDTTLDPGETSTPIELPDTSLRPTTSPVLKKKCVATGSAKRKRCSQDNDVSPKPKNSKTNSDNQSMIKKQPEKIPQLPSNKSPLFPVIKLKKTSKLTNSYVVTLFNQAKPDVKTEETESMTSSTQSSPASDTSIEHKHNTRFKARKTENEQESIVTPSLEIECDNSEVMRINGVPQDIPQVTGKVDTPSTQKQSILCGSSKYRRQLNIKRTHPVQDMKIGDIAWGKVHGHPWWPCRVMGILCESSEHEDGHQIVKVSWYGSPTTSEISCRLLMKFDEHFKHLFRKQKKGAYKLAVRQAQQDIEQLSFNSTQVIPA